MRIAILHNAVSADAPPEDQDTLVQVEAVRAALVRLGHRPATIPCTLDLSALRTELLRSGAELAFNLVESLDGADALLYLPLAVLDAIGVKYVGSRTEAMFLTSNKLLCKRRLRLVGLPTPDWVEASAAGPEPLFDATHDREDRWIVKGLWEHGSDGMDDDSIFSPRCVEELRQRLADRFANTGRRCFVERYIEGREFAAALLAGPDGPELLPPAEIDFSAFPAGKPRVVGYRAKWAEESFECLHTPRRFDFGPADRPLLDRLGESALACWREFGLRGWARVDFRVDASGRPYILEINANPCLSPDAGFAAMLEMASVPFDRAIERIVEETPT
ncbi:MAG: hypothetical protein JW959_11550 [Pirellulales bacterium]|nr:hypothetical protein [Pirellulales bacterium]